MSEALVKKRRPRTGVSLSTTRLKKMIKRLMDNLEKEDISSKASVGELVKLLQLYKELTAEQVREVEVQWVDRLRAEDESGK
jgi:hypothetical protein